jgi:two-component system, OmpR family, sensor histidine kinase BaeS
MADTDRIGQVLTNLLDNALRHTPPGGTVTMTCSRLDGWSSTPWPTTARASPASTWTTCSTGSTLRSARDRHHGVSGIGLSIARAHVEAHSGGIAVTSAGLGMAAMVTVRLTAADED